jgi:flavin-dependent dehydrogenase
MVENGVEVLLVNGSRIAIVGGGPAGSFAALNLARFAAERNLELNITILEGRDFNKPGPTGCNKCAGILSSELVHNLRKIGLEIPADLIQAELQAYILHSKGVEIPIQQPNPARRIFSVYRGAGPRLGEIPYPLSFDAWLLDQAQERGATVLREQAQQVRQGPRPSVVTKNHALDVDLVVLATGINSPMPLESGWGYTAPRKAVMKQDELLTPGGYADQQTHIFVDYPPGLIFGGVIPKGRYANISLLGQDLKPNAIDDFIQGNQLSSLFGEDNPQLCGCSPRVAISPAQGYYHDRMVVVGDAAVTRLYKDGIGSAFITAEAAARTAVYWGVAGKDFAARYRPVCQKIAQDNQYGKNLFALWRQILQHPFLLHSWHEAILAEAAQPGRERIHMRILWGIFTGDEPYRQIMGLFLKWPAISGLGLGAMRTWKRGYE